MPTRLVISLLICKLHKSTSYKLMCVCVCVKACVSQLGRVSVGYLVGSNERVHCQVVLHHFLRHVW